MGCFNWSMEQNEYLKNWNYNFAQKLKIDGIFTNDFIVDKHDGIPYAIECNPRLGSLVSLLHANSNNMADVITGSHEEKQIEPKHGTSTYTALNEIFVILDPSNYADKEFGQKNVTLSLTWKICFRSL